MHAIHTDVRSCGLLVTDPSKDGAFKFAHKSYMEFLQAQTISRQFSPKELEQISGHSIVNIWKLGIGHIQYSNNTMGSLAELLQQALHEQRITESPEIAKGRWDTLVLGRFRSRQTLTDFLKAQWLASASGLASCLVRWFSVSGSKNVLQSGLQGLVIATFASAFAGTVASAGANLGRVGFLISAVTMLVGTYTIQVTQGLVDQFGWLWPYALLFAFSLISVIGLTGLVVGLALDFLSESENTLLQAPGPMVSGPSGFESAVRGDREKGQHRYGRIAGGRGDTACRI